MLRHNLVCVCVLACISVVWTLCCQEAYSSSCVSYTAPSLSVDVCVDLRTEWGEKERGRVQGGRKDRTGNKEKSKRERATAGINYRRAPTDPKPTVDEEPCGKRAARKKKRGAVDHRGRVTIFSSQTQTDTGRLPKVPAALALKFDGPLIIGR